MPMQWTSEAIEKLFAAYLHNHSGSVNTAAIAEFMGPDCSTKAITHQIARIKNANPANGKTDTNGNKTPTKRKGAGGSSGKANKKAKKEEDDEGGAAGGAGAGITA